ncbi:putative aldo-keto reductase [Lasiosphaeris hirsuta]|uniref:Aldo-keto reductase n=1 Tax=Lasiosphaeris hirsuta TaxID=260670 RepID=A0AA40DI99_9PEZI|nr:putative aldo-keto reductase [Lasiosphaeris hirsuta]
MSGLSSTSTTTPGNSKIPIPVLGFGVYQIPADKCIAACKAALETGYRQIDTAQLYRNEEQVGAAIRQSGIKRSDVFVTTKQGLRGDTPGDTYRLAADSVKRIAGDRADAYVDLFLVHIPWIRGEAEGRKEVWQALERLFHEGKARSIGVSNYSIHHIEEMKEYATIWPPHVNQIELHPWSQQRGVVAFCERQGIALQAYSPLAEGTKMNDIVLRRIGDKYAKTPAQVLVRYGLQKGWVVLPKSENPHRIGENYNVFDFEIDEQTMEELDKLDKTETPDEV